MPTNSPADPRANDKPASSTNNTSPPRENGLGAWTQRPWLKTEALLRVLLILLILIAGLWLAGSLWQVVSSFSGLLLLFFTAWLMAVMLTGPARWFVSLGWPVPAAVAAVGALFLGGLIGFGVLVLPGLIAQTQLLISNMGGIANETEKVVNNILKNFGLTNIDLNQFSTQFQAYSTDLLKNALNFITGVANFVVQLLLVLIIAFSILAGRNYQKPERKETVKSPPAMTPLWQRLPERWRRLIQYGRLSFERNFGEFLLGQFTVAVLYGLIVGVVMGFGGFDYPITTACICGALMIIPFFGGPLSLLPPLIVAFNRDDSPIIVVLILLFVLQTLLLNVVLPKLVGKSSGVGPVMTLFALLAGAQIAGVVGVLLAVPITGVAKNLTIALVNEFLTNRNEEPAPVPAASAPDPATSKLELELAALVVSEPQESSLKP